MDKSEAISEVENLGYSYFYDEVDRFSTQEILTFIQKHIQGSKLTGAGQWERFQDAFQIVLTECSEEEIRSLAFAFALPPDADINAIREYLATIYRVIDEEIEKRK
jgi:hypothetical protein